METVRTYLGLDSVAKSEIRVSVPSDLKRLVKSLAGLKNSGRDWTLSDCVIEALELWLNQPEQQELIKRHNLDFERDDE
jgi:hypothetical protein